MAKRFDCALIDADQIVYSVGFAAKSEPISFVLQTVKNKLDKIQKECNAETRKVFIKGVGNFREKVAVTDVYKGTRPKEKPRFYEEMYQYMRDHQGAIECDWMEADDMVSHLLWEDYKMNQTPEACKLIVSSGDKDLKNTPGWHHNPRTRDLSFYTEEQATRHFWFQMLTGDKTDNIKGLPYLPYHLCVRFDTGKVAFTKGVGKETAIKILGTTSTTDEAETLVYECYIDWGKDALFSDSAVKDYVREQGQLLWMTRELDELYNPVRFKINEELYERARERSAEGRYSTELSTEAGKEEGERKATARDESPYSSEYL